MSKESEIRKLIFKQIEELYKLRKSTEKFVAGESKIPYSGRVYDEKEMINLVDASLDFWLTTGRYANQFEEEFARLLGIYPGLTNGMIGYILSKFDEFLGDR